MSSGTYLVTSLLEKVSRVCHDCHGARFNGDFVTLDAIIGQGLPIHGHQ